MEIQDLLSAFYDHELPPTDTTLVESHLNECYSCQAELTQFERLSSFAIGLESPIAPESVWYSLERELDVVRGDESSSATITSNTSTEPILPAARPEIRRADVSHFEYSRIVQFAAAIAATIMIAFTGWFLFSDVDHDHSEMVAAIHQVAGDIDSEDVRDLLRKKFGGAEVTYQDAITQVGYHPVASNELPAGYTVTSYQVLDMPCCKCMQIECRRPDNSRFYIFEHEHEETGWFEHQNQRQCTCGGKECKIAEFGDQLAATWQKNNRHITLIGLRDEQEVDLLANAF